VSGRDRFVQGWERGFTAGAGGVLAAMAGSYRRLVDAREWLYTRGLLRSRVLDCPVVGIGNLTVGGTGKTPAVELAVRTLMDLGHRPAVLSRGYGRRGGGVQIVADEASIRLDAEEAGDEPFLLARRLPGVPVVVGPNRYEAGRVARASSTASFTASSVTGTRGTSAPTARTSSACMTGSIRGGLPEVVRRATSRSSASLGYSTWISSRKRSSCASGSG